MVVAEDRRIATLLRAASGAAMVVTIVRGAASLFGPACRSSMVVTEDRRIATLLRATGGAAMIVTKVGGLGVGGGDAQPRRRRGEHHDLARSFVPNRGSTLPSSL